MKILFSEQLSEHIECFNFLAKIETAIAAASVELVKAIGTGNKILVCGNGGSAADAQHFAAEIVGRFEKQRPSFPAIALTTDSSILTAIGNDFGFNMVFARQVEGLGRKGDVLIAISTSGNSPNIIEAARTCSKKGIKTIGLLGRDGGTIQDEVDFPVTVAHERTARIQEAHSFILHFWASCIDKMNGIAND